MSRSERGVWGAGLGLQGEKLTGHRTVCVKNKPDSRDTSGRTERRPACLELREVYIERKHCFREKSHDDLVRRNSSTSLK